MGMYDYIKCLMPLPTTQRLIKKDDLFQTKDTPDQFLTIYTITEDGFLSWKPYTMVTVPEEDRPYPGGKGLLKFCGMLRREEKNPQILEDFHKDLIFYQFVQNKDHSHSWWEFKARFSYGRCDRIELVKEEHK